MENMIEVKIAGLVQDRFNSNLWVVLLEDEANKRVLPIWIGTFEANAIAMELSHQVTPRPMTHDLIKNLINSLNAKVLWVAVNDIKDNTYYAIIALQQDGREILVDARPSDSIALALRCKAPILVAQSVIEKKAAVDVDLGKEEQEEKEDSDAWIDNLVNDIQSHNKGKEPEK